MDLVVKQQMVKGNGSPRQVFFLLFSSTFSLFSFIFFEWTPGLAPIAIVLSLLLLVVPAAPPMVVSATAISAYDASSGSGSTSYGTTTAGPLVAAMVGVKLSLKHPS